MENKKLPIWLEFWKVLIDGKKDCYFYINYNKFSKVESVKVSFINSLGVRKVFPIPLERYQLVFRLYTTNFVKHVYKNDRIISTVYKPLNYVLITKDK